MAILEDENRALRTRVRELELHLRQLREIHAQVMEENVQLKDRVRLLTAPPILGPEGRVHPRVQTTFRVDTVNSRGEIAMGVARDISLGGIFVETDMRLLLNEVVTLAFELSNQPFKLHAEVVRITATGCGMEFTLEPGQQDLLQQSIERL
jgi:hypothetical protein